MNSIVLDGRVGRDAELRKTGSGTSVLNFPFVNNHRYKDRDGEYQQIPSWFRAVVYGRYGEAMERHMTKGRFCYLKGRVQVREYETEDDDGNEVTRTSVEIVVDEIEFPPKSNGDDGASGSSRSKRSSGGGKSRERAKFRDRKSSRKQQEQEPEEDYGDDDGDLPWDED